MGTPASVRDSASFRDPSGFVFRGADGLVYRQVNPVYEGEYERLSHSGLYEELTGDGLMVSHEEVSLPGDGQCRIIRPDQVPFISYPYEWSFSQYKDAALLTLEVQRRALRKGMTLKDASAYNIQFDRGRPVFIDTLSFERYEPGMPWVAYAQFCSHFLAPLALMSMTDIRLQRLMEAHIDGVPLDLAARLLPRRARLRPGLLLHLFLHAWAQRRYAGGSEREAKVARKARVSEGGMRGMVEGLAASVSGLSWRAAGTEWADYYDKTSYGDEGTEDKRRFVSELVEQAAPETAWDLGANTGAYSRIAARKARLVVSLDIDPACVEISYREARRQGETNLLPLRSDLTNPSAGLGWAHQERRSLAERGPADLVMMLALVHHLAISNNIPLGHLAEFAHRLCRLLIVEFVPKSDPQVQRLLRTRADVFAAYTREGFEEEFKPFFATIAARPVGKDGRILYFLEARA